MHDEQYPYWSGFVHKLKTKSQIENSKISSFQQKYGKNQYVLRLDWFLHGLEKIASNYIQFMMYLDKKKGRTSEVHLHYYK